MPGPPESSAIRGAPGERRNFTDIVSLFQPIVPEAGTLLQPAPNPLPPPLQAAEPSPPAAAIAAPPTPTPPPAPPLPPTRLSPPSGPEEAWAGCWEPQPNWRPRRSWTWALLIPFGLFVAYAITTLDPATVRSFVNQHIWRRDAPRTEPIATPHPAPTPAPSPPPSASAPQPTALGLPLSPVFPSAAPPPAEPAAGVPLGPLVIQPHSVESAAPATTPGPENTADTTPAPAEAAERPPLAPLQTAEPPPVQASAESTPVMPSPPPEAAPVTPPSVAAVAQREFGQIAIRYRQSSPNAEAEAARLSARVQTKAERVELRAVPTVYFMPTILYFRPEDRAAALALAKTLPTRGQPWSVRLSQRRARAGYIEVWLP